MTSGTIGRYVIKNEVGRGGMAVVYVAEDPYMKRDVVIKVMLGNLTADPEFRDRFEREAQVIAGLEHPFIVPVYDFGYHENQPYLVMRYMTGGTLSDQIEKQHALSLAECATIMERTAGALDTCHAKGIVHRDLKPGNILKDNAGDSFLADFGLIKLVGMQGKLSGQFMLGTPAYMSPEQVYGNAEVDGRADIYAMGIMLYEMLTGRAPYWDNEIPRLLMKHVMEPVPKIREARPDLSEGVEQVITTAMAKNPKDRYQTAGEFSEALNAAARGIPSRRARRRLTGDQIDAMYDALDDAADST